MPAGPAFSERRAACRTPFRIETASRTPISPKGVPVVTILWLIVWFIANLVGDHEPLLFDPVNIWTGTLILAVALDLSGAHVRGGKRGG
jgi:hypothetical protein